MTFKRTQLAICISFSLLSGCSLVKKGMEIPDNAFEAITERIGLVHAEKLDQAELQSRLIWFSDHYMDSVEDSSKLMVDINKKPSDKINWQKHKVTMMNDIMAITTGSNIYANLLDMIIFSTLNAHNAEGWMPKQYGDSAKPVVTVLRNLEHEVWNIAESTLNHDQLVELKTTIEEWIVQRGDGLLQDNIKFSGIASEIARMNKNQKGEQTSVFHLLMIDPFAGIDPATREILNTRLMGERFLFLSRHMPVLLRLETEILAQDSVEIPQIGALLSSIQQLSAAADRMSLIGEQLPKTITTERQHLFKEFNSSRPGMMSLSEQIDKTLVAGRDMSDATDKALQTYKAIQERLFNEPEPADGHHFRIDEYTEAANAINEMSKTVNILFESFNKTLDNQQIDALSQRIEQLNQHLEKTAHQTVDYAFERLLAIGLILMLAFSVITIITFQICIKIKKG